MPDTNPNNSSKAVPKAPVLTFPTMYGRYPGKYATNPKSATIPSSSPHPSTRGGDSNSKNDNKGFTEGQHAVAGPTTAHSLVYSTTNSGLKVDQWLSEYVAMVSKDNGAVEFQKLVEMRIEKRISLLTEPFIDVMCGAQKFQFPIYLMALICPKIRREDNWDSVRPIVDELVVQGVQRLNEFFMKSLSATRPFRLRSAGDDAAGFALDLDTITAAEMLGIGQLVGPLRSYWWRWLKTTPIEDLDFDMLNAIEKRISTEFKSTIIEMVIQTQAKRYAHGEMKEPGRTKFRSSIILLPKMWHRFHRNLKTERSKVYQT